MVGSVHVFASGFGIQGFLNRKFENVGAVDRPAARDFFSPGRRYHDSQQAYEQFFEGVMDGSLAFAPADGQHLLRDDRAQLVDVAFAQSVPDIIVVHHAHRHPIATFAHRSG